MHLIHEYVLWIYYSRSCEAAGLLENTSFHTNEKSFTIGDSSEYTYGRSCRTAKLLSGYFQEGLCPQTNKNAKEL